MLILPPSKWEMRVISQDSLFKNDCTLTLATMDVLATVTSARECRELQMAAWLDIARKPLRRQGH